MMIIRPGRAIVLPEIGVQVGSVRSTADAGGGGGDTPPTTNLQLWLKADSYVLSDNTTITTNWSDNSPSARSVAPTGGVTLQTVELNTSPIVRFNGTNGLFTLSSALALGSAHTIVWVSTHTNALKVLIGDSGVNYMGSFTGSQFVYTGLNSPIRQDFFSGLTTSMAIRAFRRSGSTTALWENGAGKTRTQTRQTTDAFTFTKLGGFSGFLYAGDLAEILIYDIDLSDTDLNIVGNYLETRYAIAWNDI